MEKLWSYSVDTLTEPVQAFRRMREEPAVVWSLVVVCVASLASLGIAPMETGPLTLGFAVGSIVGDLIYLLIGVALVHGAARLLGARGNFWATVTAFGFAGLPMLVSVPVYLLFESLGIVALAEVGLFAFLVWSFVLSVLAVREVYEVSTGMAVGVLALAVAVPVMVVLLAAVVLGVSLAGLLYSIAGM